MFLFPFTVELYLLQLSLATVPLPDCRMPRDEETVDRIFAGNLDGLPPLSSKVVRIFTRYHSLY